MNKNLDRNDRSGRKGVSNSQSEGYGGEVLKSLALYLKSPLLKSFGLFLLLGNL